MESAKARWEKKGIFRYQESEDQFKSLLVPTVSRCVMLLALYLFLGFGVISSTKTVGPVFNTLLILFFLWPLFQDLRAVWPVTIYRSGKIKFLIRSKYLEEIDKTKVYSVAYGNCPEIGLISKEITSRSRRIRLIDGAKNGPEYHLVGDELANWLQIKHQKGSYAMRARAPRLASPKR